MIDLAQLMNPNGMGALPNSPIPGGQQAGLPVNPVAPPQGPAATPEEHSQRVNQWEEVMNKLLDPTAQGMLFQIGTRLMQPRAPGVGVGAHFSDALQGSMQHFGQRQAERKANERMDKKEGWEERRVKAEEAKVQLDKEKLTQDQAQWEREVKIKEKQATDLGNYYASLARNAAGRGSGLTKKDAISMSIDMYESQLEVLTAQAESARLFGDETAAKVAQDNLNAFIQGKDAFITQQVAAFAEIGSEAPAAGKQETPYFRDEHVQRFRSASPDVQAQVLENLRAKYPDDTEFHKRATALFGGEANYSVDKEGKMQVGKPAPAGEPKTEPAPAEKETPAKPKKVEPAAPFRREGYFDKKRQEDEIATSMVQEEIDALEGKTPAEIQIWLSKNRNRITETQREYLQQKLNSKFKK